MTPELNNNCNNSSTKNTSAKDSNYCYRNGIGEARIEHELNWLATSQPPTIAHMYKSLLEVFGHFKKLR